MYVKSLISDVNLSDLFLCNESHNGHEHCLYQYIGLSLFERAKKKNIREYLWGHAQYLLTHLTGLFWGLQAFKTEELMWLLWCQGNKVSHALSARTVILACVRFTYDVHEVSQVSNSKVVIVIKELNEFLLIEMLFNFYVLVYVLPLFMWDWWHKGLTWRSSILPGSWSLFVNLIMIKQSYVLLLLWLFFSTFLAFPHSFSPQRSSSSVCQIFLWAFLSVCPFQTHFLSWISWTMGFRFLSFQESVCLWSLAISSRCWIPGFVYKILELCPDNLGHTPCFSVIEIEEDRFHVCIADIDFVV